MDNNTQAILQQQNSNDETYPDECPVYQAKPWRISDMKTDHVIAQVLRSYIAPTSPWYGSSENHKCLLQMCHTVLVS